MKKLRYLGEGDLHLEVPGGHALPYTKDTVLELPDEVAESLLAKNQGAPKPLWLLIQFEAGPAAAEKPTPPPQARRRRQELRSDHGDSSRPPSQIRLGRSEQLRNGRGCDQLGPHQPRRLQGQL